MKMTWITKLFFNTLLLSDICVGCEGVLIAPNYSRINLVLYSQHSEITFS